MTPYFDPRYVAARRVLLDALDALTPHRPAVMARSFGGVPVLTGEWGSSPSRATGKDDDYFNTHQALQDRYRISSTLWTWTQSCGDPHSVNRDGSPATSGWSVYEMDCTNGQNRVVGQFPMMRKDLRRAYVRRAPGRLISTSFSLDNAVLKATGKQAKPTDGPIEIFFPSGLRAGQLRVQSSGTRSVTIKGSRVLATPSGGAWKLTVRVAKRR